jgi:bifunctional non-homologous end joining protein LigD
MVGDSARSVLHACELGLEGIVSKHLGSPYRSGRRESWRKSKCERTDNFSIIAFVVKLGAKPRRIASLCIGRREGDRLVYAGKVQSGYSLPVAQEVREALVPYTQSRSPLTTPIDKPKATWVRPGIDAEVAYSSLTDRGLVREAAFKGLRDDLAVPPPNAPHRVGPPRHSPQRRRGPEGRHPAASARRRRADRGRARRLLAEGRKARAGPSWKPATQAGASCRQYYLLSQGPAAPIPRSVHQLTVAKRAGGEGVKSGTDAALATPVVRQTQGYARVGVPPTGNEPGGDALKAEL